MHHASTPTIFLTGRFRSGTTALWQALRTSDSFVGFYEPLHDNLFQYYSSGGVDPSHIGVRDYFNEYKELTEDFWGLYRPDFGFNQLCLSARDSYPALHHYLSFLISQHEQRISLFKFVRADFRLPWLKATFQDALIVSVLRDPRENWWSIVRRTHGTDPTSRDLNTGYDLMLWSAALAPYFPPLVSGEVTHSYERAYLIWRISSAVATHYADLIIHFDSEIQTDPVGSIARILALVRSSEDPAILAATLVRSPPSSKPDLNFSAMEARCDRLLEGSDLLKAIADGSLSNASWPISPSFTGETCQQATTAVGHALNQSRSTLIGYEARAREVIAAKSDEIHTLCSMIKEKDRYIESLLSAYDLKRAGE